MTYETIKIERDGDSGVTTLTFNRPDQRNAMNPRMHEDMTSVLEELWYDDATRVLVITGAGPAFCAGMDLKQFFLLLQDDPKEYERVGRMSIEWRGRTLRHFPKPTIAKINGYCFGGAFSIVESCDIAVAATDATFGLSEINFGMFPGGSVSKALGNLLGPRDALFYGLTGRRFDGRRASEIGLVNYAVDAEKLDVDVIDLATEIAGHDPEALRATKEAYRFSLGMDWDAAVSYSIAREQQLTLIQNNAWRDDNLAAFADGQYKPGLQARHQVGK